jgi:hypothetical protein
MTDSTEHDQRDERIEALSAQVRAADKRALAAERETAMVRGNLEREIAQCKATMAGMHAERGELQRECDRWKGKALATQETLDRDDRIAAGMSTAELVAEVKRARETRGCLIGEVQQLKTTCANQRKELHALNVERAKTLTKLEETQRRVAELESDCDRLRALAEASARANTELKRKSYPAALDLTPDCAPIAESPFPAAVAVAHGVVSTSDLSAFEISAATACDAMHVDADGLGFVKREWLDRHRASVAQQRRLLAEPAERKAQEEQKYGRVEYGPLTLDEMEESPEEMGHGHVIDLIGHLRETLATIDAVTGLAQRWETWHLGTLVGADFEAASARCARELREVLNGKR